MAGIVEEGDYMKSKNHVLLFAMIALIAFVLIFVLFLPRPIVEDPYVTSIVRIIFNPYLNQNIDAAIDIKEYNEENILACLSQYKERRTMSKATGYWLGDVEIEIIINTDDGLRSILLGNINYSYNSYGKLKNKILHADNLRLDIMKFIDI